MSDENESPDLNQEQAALLAGVSQVDNLLTPEAPDEIPSSGATVGGQPAEIEDPIEEIFDTLKLGVEMGAPLFPFLPVCYPDFKLRQIARAIHAVAVKYGWEIKGNIPPELILAGVAIPPTVQAFLMWKLMQEQAAMQGGQEGGDGNQ